MCKFKLNRDNVLAIVVLIIILGSLVLAFVDPTARPLFADLARMFVSAYLGFKAGQK